MSTAGACATSTTTTDDSIQNVNGVLITPLAAVRPSDVQFLCRDGNTVLAGLLFGEEIVKVPIYTLAADGSEQETIKRLAAIVVPDDEQWKQDDSDDDEEEDEDDDKQTVTAEKEAELVAAAIAERRRRKKHH